MEKPDKFAQFNAGKKSIDHLDETTVRAEQLAKIFAQIKGAFTEALWVMGDTPEIRGRVNMILNSIEDELGGDLETDPKLLAKKGEDMAIQAVRDFAPSDQEKIIDSFKTILAERLRVSGVTS